VIAAEDADSLGEWKTFNFGARRRTVVLPKFDADDKVLAQALLKCGCLIANPDVASAVDFLRKDSGASVAKALFSALEVNCPNGNRELPLLDDDERSAIKEKLMTAIGAEVQKNECRRVCERLALFGVLGSDQLGRFEEGLELLPDAESETA
jgi:hypothetical protein